MSQKKIPNDLRQFKVYDLTEIIDLKNFFINDEFINENSITNLKENSNIDLLLNSIKLRDLEYKPADNRKLIKFFDEYNNIKDSKFSVYALPIISIWTKESEEPDFEFNNYDNILKFLQSRGVFQESNVSILKKKISYNAIDDFNFSDFFSLMNKDLSEISQKLPILKILNKDFFSEEVLLFNFFFQVERNHSFQKKNFSVNIWGQDLQEILKKEMTFDHKNLLFIPRDISSPLNSRISATYVSSEIKLNLFFSNHFRYLRQNFGEPEVKVFNKKKYLEFEIIQPFSEKSVGKLMIELENFHDFKSILNAFEKLMYDFQFSEYEFFNY
jgi:hypothetical protein